MKEGADILDVCCGPRMFYDRASKDRQDVILQKSVCLGRHQWRLETEGPEVFVAVCSRCGKRTTDPGVLLKLLDDFSPRRRRWMR